MAKQRNQFDFQIGISTDRQTGEILSLYFQFRKGKAEDVVEIVDGAAFANYDKHGNLLGIELLEPCSAKVLVKFVEKDEPVSSRRQISRFVKQTAPREMLIA